MQVDNIQPVAENARIQSLDVLRGFAVLGILAMNIQSFALPSITYTFPETHGNFEGANYWTWYLAELLARNKFMGLFSILFGAGIVLMHERATAAGRGLAGLHCRRMGVLWLIGMIHAYLFWYGDILVAYAACGMLLYLFRAVRPSRLLISALIFLALGSALSLMAGLSAPYWPEENLAEFQAQVQPSAEKIVEEIGAMQGGWWGAITHRAPEVFMMQIGYFFFHTLWRATGFMLLGMALFKWRILSGEGSRRLYLIFLVLGVVLGLPLVHRGIESQIASGWDPAFSMFVGSQWNYWGALLVSLAYMSLILLILRAGLWRALAERLGAVGRMAFSNYLLQTLICTMIFNGRGLALFGEVERVGQAGIVLGIWILQLIVSPLWLAHFRFGPVEWLWRSLSYRERQPMRRAAA